MTLKKQKLDQNSVDGKISSSNEKTNSNWPASSDSNSGKENRRMQQFLQGMTLLDDICARAALRRNPHLIKMMIERITKEKGLHFTNIEVQKELSFIGGSRGVRYDAFTENEEGIWLVEIQIDSRLASPERMRYLLSSADAEQLRPGQDFSQLRNTVLIFIMDEDYLGLGEPVYEAEMFFPAHGIPLKTRQKILIVNGSYRGNDEIGELMHDFNISNPDDMMIPEFKEAMHWLKQTKQGEEEMSDLFHECFGDLLQADVEREVKKQLDLTKAEYQKIGFEQGMEQGIQQGIEQGIGQGIEQGIEQGIVQGSEKSRKEVALNLLKNGFSMAETSKLTSLSESAVADLLGSL